MLPKFFNRSSLLGRELEYIFQTMTVGQIAGDRTYSKKCHAPLERTLVQQVRDSYSIWNDSMTDILIDPSTGVAVLL
jgi:hypothetical protein